MDLPIRFSAASSRIKPLPTLTSPDQRKPPRSQAHHEGLPEDPLPHRTSLAGKRHPLFGGRVQRPMPRQTLGRNLSGKRAPIFLLIRNNLKNHDGFWNALSESIDSVSWIELEFTVFANWFLNGLDSDERKSRIPLA